jgi:hypothetical protein
MTSLLQTLALVAGLQLFNVLKTEFEDRAICINSASATTNIFDWS